MTVREVRVELGARAYPVRIGPGLLASAVHRPRARMFGTAAYEDPHEQAAALLHALATNHPFVDGNKRTALVVCELFLVKNGHRLNCTDAELLAVFLDAAAGEATEDELASLLRDRVSPS